MDTTPPARPPGRPRLKEDPKKPPKKFRNVHVSFKKKQAVIDSFDEIGQDTQGDGDAALATFSARVAQVVRDNDIDVIYNADQTVEGPRNGHSYSRLTGKKNPLFLVLKMPASKIKAVVQENLTLRQGFGKQLWKDVEPLQSRFQCRIYVNPTAWWNSLIGADFLRYHFADPPDRATKKVLLLWDEFSAHFTDEVVACAGNVVLDKIPPL
ncbi:hypothetical protein DYB35_013923 [Aphanomyces astaci]|nr:hypothetical protein DYB35_013923 [Aphanomyces astaci]